MASIPAILNGRTSNSKSQANRSTGRSLPEVPPERPRGERALTKSTYPLKTSGSHFVDTPEADSGGYVAERIGEQAKEFGITEEESVEMGKKATAFNRAVLSRPFKVSTRGQNALGASQIKREYAFVETADGEDLGEMLVSRGMARSFG